MSTGLNDPCHCPHCGNFHTGQCPRIKAIEYHDCGTIRRVEYHAPIALETGTTPNRISK
jgi:hypothetical protein